MQNVKTPNKPMEGTKLRNFLASGGKIKEFTASKGLKGAKGCNCKGKCSC